MRRPCPTGGLSRQIKKRSEKKVKENFDEEK
jgi:hypothetical protein